jgi:hypothetical protein
VIAPGQIVTLQLALLQRFLELLTLDHRLQLGVLIKLNSASSQLLHASSQPDQLILIDLRLALHWRG